MSKEESKDQPHDDRFTEEMQLEFVSEDEDEDEVAKVKKDISGQLTGPDAETLRKHL